MAEAENKKNITTRESRQATSFWHVASGILLVVLVGLLYRRTLHPGVGPYLDSIEYQLTTLTWGVSHPPGYPLFTWLGALFVHLLPFNNPAFRLNLLSWVASVSTVWLTQRIIYRLTRSLIIATLGALTLAVAVRFWYQANYTELYPLYNSLLAATLLALLTFAQTRSPRAYFASVILYALCFGVNVPAIVLLPMWLWVVLTTDWRMVTNPRTLALTALIVGVIAAQYAWIPLRALSAQPPRFCNFCPRTWAEVPDFLTGKRWWGISFGLPPKYWLQRWADSGYQLMLQFWPIGVMLGGLGWWSLFKRQTQIAVMWLLGLAGTWFFVTTYAVVDWDDFMTPVYVVFAPLIAVGGQVVWHGVRARINATRTVTQLVADRFDLTPKTIHSLTKTMRVSGIVLTILWLMLVARNNYPLVDQSQEYVWHGWARDLLPLFEDAAWLLTPPTATDGFVQTWVLRYISWAEDIHPEMTVVYLPGGEFDPPGPAPGYITWQAAEPYLREHPVYLIELNDERVYRYVLLPLHRGDGWPLGYRIVGERTGDGLTPWVSAADWAAMRDDVLLLDP